MRAALVVFLLLVTSLALFPADAQQGGGPVLDKIELEDQWSGQTQVPDGRLDTVRLTFTQPIEEATFKLSDVTVDGRDVLSYSMFSTQVIVLRMQENVYDTDAVPAVGLRSGHTMKGTSGAAVTVTATAEDHAGPVLVSARAPVGSDSVQLIFSEEVGTLTAADFTYQDDGSGTAIQSVASAGGVHTLTLNQPIEAGDLAGDQILPKNTIKDTAGNIVVQSSSGLVTDRAAAAWTNIGSDTVRVVFSVPVQGVSKDAFDIVYDTAPESPIAGVTGVEILSPFEALVTLTDSVRVSDVRSSQPAQLQVLGGTITHTSGAALPSATLPLIDRTPPRLQSVSTNDTDQNGFIDAMELVWSEPIAAICWEGIGEAGLRVIDLEGKDFELDLVTNQVPNVDGRTATVRIKERVTLPSDTGLVPQFTALACDSGAAPFQDLAEPANRALDVRLGLLDETDGAPPAIILGTTRDQDGDGFLDGYVLGFSEEMTQSAISPTNWAVDGHKVTGGTWNGPQNLTISFSELEAAKSNGDTGDRPAVSYRGESVKDAAVSPQPLRKFDGGGFLKVDGAFPVITDAFGDAGSKVLRLVFSEPVEAVNDQGAPGRGIRESDLAFQNSGGGNSGIFSVTHGKGDRVAYLNTAGNLLESDFGSSGDRVLPLEDRIRESNSKPAAERQPLQSEFVSFTEKDVDAPAAITAGTWVVTSHNATYTFAAPGDDGDGGGNVTGYLVHANLTALPELEVDAFLALTPWLSLSSNPAEAAPGADQSLTLGDLCPSVTYYAAFAAFDEDANLGTPHLASPVTLDRDDSPPTGDLAFLSSTYLLNETGAPIATHLLNGSVVWSGAEDAESCNMRYYWALSQDPDYALSPLDNVTVDPGVEFDLPKNTPRPMQTYLHVAAANDHDLLGTAGRFPIHFTQPAECSQENILAPDLDVIHEGGFTRITWDPLELELPDGFTLEGYQVWYQRATGKAWQLREELSLPLEELKFIDDLAIDSAATYLVTGYFTDGLCQFAVEDGELMKDASGETPLDTFEGPSVHIIRPEPAVPTWAWVTLVAISLFIVGGVGLFYGMRRTKLDESWLVDEVDADDENPFGSDPIQDLGTGEGAVEDDPFGQAPAGEGAGPTLEIACPACTHNFQVQGHRPLQISCPSCHASGVLE